MLNLIEGAKIMGFLSRTTGYIVTERRVFIALNVAACIGAVLVLWPFASRSLTNIRFFNLAEQMFFYVIAHFIWFFGIAVLGGPVWMVMHQQGLRHWIHAGLTGGVLLGIACMAVMTGFFTGYSNFHQSETRAAGQWIWVDGKLTAEGWSDALKSSLWISLLGVILGLVIWRIAYRRVAG